MTTDFDQIRARTATLIQQSYCAARTVFFKLWGHDPALCGHHPYCCLFHLFHLTGLIILGAFAKLRKATISLVMSVCLSAWNKLGCQCTDFDEIWYYSTFRKSAKKIQVLWKSDKNSRYFTLWPIHFFTISRSILVRMTNSLKKCRGNQNTHFMFSNFFRKTHRLWDNVKKYSRAREATIYNVAHAHFTLDT